MFCAGHMHSLTIPTWALYVSTVVVLVLVPTYVYANMSATHENDTTLTGPKWSKMADVAKCRANIFQHVADMLIDTSRSRQNWRRQHPTNPTKCVLSPQDMYLSPDNVETLSSINFLYCKMVHDVMRLKGMDFSKLREPRIGYAMQQEIQQSHVDLATVAMIHYFLYPGMLIRYVKGKYVGENRDFPKCMMYCHLLMKWTQITLNKS